MKEHDDSYVGLCRICGGTVGAVADRYKGLGDQRAVASEVSRMIRSGAIVRRVTADFVHQNPWCNCEHEEPLLYVDEVAREPLDNERWAKLAKAVYKPEEE